MATEIIYRRTIEIEPGTFRYNGFIEEVEDDVAAKLELVGDAEPTKGLPPPPTVAPISMTSRMSPPPPPPPEAE